MRVKNPRVFLGTLCYCLPIKFSYCYDFSVLVFMLDFYPYLNVKKKEMFDDAMIYLEPIHVTIMLILLSCCHKLFL